MIIFSNQGINEAHTHTHTPVSDDPLHDVVGAEAVLAVQGPEYSSPPRFLSIKN